MKMKSTMYLAVLGAVCLLTGCGQKQDAPNESHNGAQSQAEVSVDVSSPAAITIGVPSEQEPGEAVLIPYLGTWEITACRGTAAVYAMSQAEIDGMIGKTVAYETDKFYHDSSSEGIAAVYREEMVADSRLSEDFNVTFADMGVSGSEFLHAEVEGTEGNFFGTYFYVLDENTLLIYYEGVFFEAVRVS